VCLKQTINLHRLESQQNPLPSNIRKLWKNKFSNRPTLKGNVDTIPKYGNRADLLRGKHRKPLLDLLFFLWWKGDAIGLLNGFGCNALPSPRQPPTAQGRLLLQIAYRPLLCVSISQSELYEICCIPYTVKLEATVWCTFVILMISYVQFYSHCYSACLNLNRRCQLLQPE
jgi:hypothetical protein